MSNIGKVPISIPTNIKIDVIDNYIIIQGKIGVIVNTIPTNLKLIRENNLLYIKIINNESYAMWGTFRTLINNAIIGVTKGYIIKLKMIGIGYKASMTKSILRLKIGYINTIKVFIPSEIKIKCVKNNIIYLYSSNLQQIKQIAASIRAYKKPDIYKGKGIRFADETVILKEGKKKTK